MAGINGLTFYQGVQSYVINYPTDLRTLVRKTGHPNNLLFYSTH